MIPQTIPNDVLEAFRKHLIRESFSFEWPLVETLGQVISAWEDERLHFFNNDVCEFCKDKSVTTRRINICETCYEGA